MELDNPVTTSRNASRKMKKREQMSIFAHMRYNPFLYLIALPGIIFYFIFSYMPMYGVMIAFKEYDLTKGILGSPWAGWRNFEFFLTSGKLSQIVYNTLFLNVLFLIGTTVFAVTIALLVNEVRLKLFKRVSQSLIFLPFFMSWIVISMMVSAILGGHHPAMNQWLEILGLPAMDWMFTPEYWPWILLVIRIWQGSGYAAIIYMATITSISTALYEAARIDGASRRQIMLRITLPLLVPTISILTLLAVGKIFTGDFGMIYAIVGDNPMLYPTTDVIDTYVYRSMRQLNDFGMSAAVGLSQSVMGFVLILCTNAVVRRFSQQSSLF